MKVYSIGREAGCDIVINDSTDVISRRHAILNVQPSGKMTIVDQSHNGTYVNGIRISQNVPVPVTRKDNISFAHVARLDWGLVPKPVSAMRYVAFGVAALAILVGGYFAYDTIFNKPDVPVTPADTVKVKTEEEIKKEINDSIIKADSIKKVQQEAIEKAKKDSIRRANENNNHGAGKKPVDPKKPNDGKKDDPNKGNQKTPTGRQFR